MNNQSVLAAAPDHIADARKMVASDVQGEPSRKDLYKEFSEWCHHNRGFGLDCRLHTHGGPIDHGGYISDEKTRIAFAAYRAGRLLAQQPAEQPECGRCGQTVKCDDDCDAVIFRKADQQPQQDVAGLVDLLRDIGDVCRQLEMPSERAIAEWADRIDAALAAHFKRDSQPSPAIQEGYAGATVWIGDKRVTQVVTEGSLKHESEPGMAITHAAQACLDLLAAAHRKGAKP